MVRNMSEIMEILHQKMVSFTRNYEVKAGETVKGYAAYSSLGNSHE
ncbi:hypothetical protein AB1K91_01675 [Terribacillus sp. 179-K 1B1 HS]